MWLDASDTGHPGEVSGIACPTLLVRGDDDHLVDLPVVAELRQAIEGSHFLNLPFAGHLAYLEQPEIFAASLRRFLEAPP